MSKTKDFLTHRERLRNVQALTPPPFVTDDDELVSSTESVNIDGILTQRTVIKHDKPSQRNKGLTIFDFRMESLIASGAASTLSEVNLGAPSSLKDIDTISNSLSSIPEPSNSKSNASEIE